MDMGIVNAGLLPLYDDIEPNMKNLIEDVVFNRSVDGKHVDRLIDFAENFKNSKSKKVVTEKAIDEWRTRSVEERLKHSLVKVKIIFKLTGNKRLYCFGRRRSKIKIPFAS